MTYTSDLDVAERLAAAIENYTSRGWATHVIPDHGTHPTRVLVVPEPDRHTDPVKVFVVTVTAGHNVSTEDEWIALSAAYGFTRERDEIARSLGLTDPDDNRHRFEEQPK